MMIDESIGIQMCRNKKIRKQYGTITYQENKIVLSDPKAHYDEIHALIKKEKKKEKKKSEPKIVDIQKMTKEDQIKKLVDSPLDDFTLDESNLDKDLSFMDEPIEIKSGSNKPVEVEQGDKEEKEEEKEEQLNIIQEGGRLTKKIYVTDLSVEKDKEMFQM